MEHLKESDLDVQLNLGLVCNGKLRDLSALRDLISSAEGVKVVFNTLAAEYLFIVKKSALSPEQQRNYTKTEKKLP